MDHFVRSGYLASAIVVLMLAGSAYAQPTAAWLVPERFPVERREYEVICRVQWQGKISEYAVLPIEPLTLDWASLTLDRLESSSSGDSYIVDQVFTLTSAAPGSYTLPPLEIPFLATTADANGKPEPEAVSAQSMSIEVLPDHRSLYLAAGAAGVTAVAVGAVLVGLRIRRRRNAGSRPLPGQVDIDEIRRRLKAAGIARLEGDYYGFYQRLTDVARQAAPGDADLIGTLERRGQEVGYKKLRPEEAWLDSDQRAVERAVKRAEAKAQDAMTIEEQTA